MDPITLTSIVASSLGIADVITRLGFGLKRLQDDFSGALDHVDNIIQQIGTVDLAIREICWRLDRSPDTFPQSFESRLTDSTTAIDRIIKQIGVHAQAVKNEADDSRTKGKILHLRYAHKVKQWETSLAAQTQALSLLLLVAQLRSSDERTSVLEQESSKKLFERASSMSAKYHDSPCNPSSSHSCPTEIKNFAFDSILLATKVYRRACESLWRREITQIVVDIGSNASVSTSLVSSNDAVASQTGPLDPEPPYPSNARNHEPLSSFTKHHGASRREDLALDGSGQESVSIRAAPELSRTSLPTAIITAPSSSIHANNIAAVTTIPSTAGRRGPFDCQQPNSGDTPDDMDASLQKSEKEFRTATQKNTALKLPMNPGSSVQPFQETSEISMTYTTTSSSSIGLDTSVTENSSSTQRTGTTVATTIPSVSDSKDAHGIQPKSNSGLGKSVVMVNVEHVGSDHVNLAIGEVSRHYDIVRDSIARIRDSILMVSGIDPATYRGHMISCTIETCGEAVHKFPFTAAFLAAGLEKMEEGLYSSIDIITQFSTPHLQNTGDVAAQTITSKGETREGKVLHTPVGITARPITTIKDGMPHFILDKDYHLPMSRQAPEAKGGYSHIFKIQIHPDNRYFPRGRDAEKPNTIAIKRLRSTDYRAFQREAHVLRTISRQSTRFSIVRLLATFEYKGFYHLVFPWAAGNLLEYWREHDISTKLPECHLDNRISDLHWMLQQCAEIASAITQIHSVLNKPARSTYQTPSSESQQLRGRHGDIKPANILCYSGGEFGKFKLVIGDFGLTRFHGSSQTTRTGLIQRTACTPTYRAPEYDLLSTGVNMTSAYDLWSLGCVFLEFATWLVSGDAQRKAFGRNRATYDKDGAFFITRGGKFMVNPAVSCELKKLMAIPGGFAPTLHRTMVLFLGITESCLEIEDGNRPTADLLSKQLQSLQNSVSPKMTSFQGVKIFMNEPTLISHTEIARMLVSRGVDINAQGGYHMTALQAAASEGYFEIVQLLLKKGAGIDAESKRYKTALQAALRGRHAKILLWLLLRIRMLPLSTAI